MELALSSGGRGLVAAASGAVIARFAETMKQAFAAWPGARKSWRSCTDARPICLIRLEMATGRGRSSSPASTRRFALSARW